MITARPHSSTKINITKLGTDLFQVPLDFRAIDVEYLRQLSQDILLLSEETYNGIAALSTSTLQIRFETAVQPLINLELFTAKAKALCTFAMQVHPDENIRKCSEEIEKNLSKMEIDCQQRKDVFKVLQTYENDFYIIEEIVLDAEENRYFLKLMRDYKRNGLDKTESEIASITALKKQITELSSDFETNLRNENTNFTFSRSELEGMPADWFTKERETEPEKYKVSLKYPDYFPAMDYVKNRDVRKQLYIAYQTRCAKDNLPLLTKIVQLRQQLAARLGYETYVDSLVDIRMAKTGQTIRQFLDEMLERFRPLYQTRLQKLINLAQETDQLRTFENYDFNYYNRLLIQQELNFEMEEFNSYFSLNKVIDGTLKIYQQLLGLKFIEIKTHNKWHEDVKMFEVFNWDALTQTSGQHIGTFYLDLHPREGKYSHAAVFDLVPGADISHLTKNPDERQLPLIAMVCNFPQDGKYLSFDQDVVTFFHEFGHLMHFICNKTKLPMFHAFKTELDFVEAPSQMLENWCYDQRVLTLLSSHPETGQPIPAQMISKLKELRIANDSIENLRQLVMGNFDYYTHSLSAEDAANIDIKACYREIQRAIRHPIAPIADECFASAFSHMVNGYEVGYYGYLMSNTYAMDMYAAQFQADPLSPIAGALYRKCILEPGSTLDGMQLLSNFLGRSPSVNAFIESYGLKQPTSPLRANSMLRESKENLEKPAAALTPYPSFH